MSGHKSEGEKPYASCDGPSRFLPFLTNSLALLLHGLSNHPRAPTSRRALPPPLSQTTTPTTMASSSSTASATPTVAPSVLGKREALGSLSFKDHPLYKKLCLHQNLGVLKALICSIAPDALSMHEILALARVRAFAEFITKARCGAAKPLVGFGFDKVVAAAEDACDDVDQIMHFDSIKYNTPSPDNTQGKTGAGRPRLLGRLLQHVLKSSAKACYTCGTSFADYKAASQHWSAVHFDHRSGETKDFDPSHCATMDVKVAMTEYAKCEIVCARCHHHGGTKKGSVVGAKPEFEVSYL